MKRQVRNGVFETNSSSTHSICISKAPVGDIKNRYVSFNIGEYGWENDCVDICDYLYTAILQFSDSDELLKKLKDILDKHLIKYEFEQPKYEMFGKEKWLSYGSVDHAGETRDFVETVLSDEDMLMRCLFGDSFVNTGNDNQDCCPDGCDIAKEYYWDWNGNMKENPHHDPENYDYFYKGN